MTLLEDERASVGSIAEQLGYADPSNFHRAFRRWMGVGPTEWREQRQKAR